MKYSNIVYGWIGLLAIFASPLLFAGSFFNPVDSVTDQQTMVVGGEHKLISIAFYAEWEPGMAREIRQITIDNSGAGQVSVRVDNVLTGLSTFSYHADLFHRWHKQAVSDLAVLYVSTEMEMQGIVVEGNADSHKFYFLYPHITKIVDTEPGYSKTPQELTQLADEVSTLSSAAQTSELSQQYFVMTPLGEQKSLSIINRFASISAVMPEVQDVRKVLTEDQRIAIDKPTWLVAMPGEVSVMIKRLFKTAQEDNLKRNFFYARTAQGNVVKMEFLHAR